MNVFLALGTMMIMTNMYYAEAPLLMPNSVEAASCMVWKEISLAGSTARDFEKQITELQPFLKPVNGQSLNCLNLDRGGGNAHSLERHSGRTRIRARRRRGRRRRDEGRERPSTAVRLRTESRIARVDTSVRRIEHLSIQPVHPQNLWKVPASRLPISTQYVD